MSNNSQDQEYWFIKLDEGAHEVEFESVFLITTNTNSDIDSVITELLSNWRGDGEEEDDGTWTYANVSTETCVYSAQMKKLTESEFLVMKEYLTCLAY